MTLYIIVLVISIALVLGAVWGLYGHFPKRIEGFVLAVSGGALIVAVMLELLQPAAKTASLWVVIPCFLTGSAVFVLIDMAIHRIGKGGKGGGLLAAVILDGVPENLALGVSLIGTGPGAALSLAGSIFLSNLPEAAGGAREMERNGLSKAKALGLWTATAAVLALTAIAGNFFLSNVAPFWLALIKSFAAGAVISSLATEVFPEAYEDDHRAAGVAISIGLAIAFVLHTVGQG